MTRVVDAKSSQIFNTVEEFETAENLAILSEKDLPLLTKKILKKD